MRTSNAAAQAAYKLGEPWVEELCAYLDDNFAFVGDYLSEHLPRARYRASEATYLAWVDLGDYFGPDDDLPRFFAYNAGVLLEGGNMFVQNSDGFIRLNLARPRAMLQEGMRRICDAVNGHVRHNGRDKEAASDRKSGQAWQNGRVCMDEGGAQRPCRDRNGLLPRSFAMITAGRIPRLALWHNQEPSRQPQRPMHTRRFCYETTKSRRKTAGHALPDRAATADKTGPLGLHKMM